MRIWCSNCGKKQQFRLGNTGELICEKCGYYRDLSVKKDVLFKISELLTEMDCPKCNGDGCKNCENSGIHPSARKANILLGELESTTQRCRGIRANRMKVNRRPKMIIMCGYPACGKNTWIDNHKKGYVVVELDAIRRNIFGHQFHTNAEPFVIGFAKSMSRLLLSQGQNIIINSTGLTRWIRQEWYNIGKEYNADITVVWVRTYQAICEDRNKKRVDNQVPSEAMDRMFNLFQPPSMDVEDECNIKLQEVKGV